MGTVILKNDFGAGFILAPKDIVAYKVVIVSKKYNSMNEYFTVPMYRDIPASCFTSNMDFTASVELVTKVNGEGYKKIDKDGNVEIFDGYIHSFVDFEDAKKYMEDMHGTADYMPAIYKSIIPAGEKFMIGKSNYLRHSYKMYVSPSVKMGEMVCCRIKGKTYGSPSEYHPNAMSNKEECQ